MVSRRPVRDRLERASYAGPVPIDLSWDHPVDFIVAEGKAHGEPCARCAERPRCEGPWREYPARFGWDEFVPIAALHRAPLTASET